MYNIWSWLVDTLGEKAYTNNVMKIENRKIEMFHSSTDEDSKERVLCNFKMADSSIRILVCTVAFGMGVNIPDIDIVVHWGSAKSVLSYWQEIGRGGRSGNPALALMYAYPRSLMKIVTDETMKEICNSHSCIRRNVLLNLLTKSMSPDKLPHAKANCNKTCNICTCLLCSCCGYCASTNTCTGKMNTRDRFFVLNKR